MSFSRQDMVDDGAWEGRFAAIQAEADAILASEGKHRVAGRHFALEKDAHVARMVEAEARVARRDRMMDLYLATPRVQGSRV